MPTLLSIETATEVCSVALSKETEILAIRNIAEGMRHSSVLTSLITEVLCESSKELRDVSAIALSNGPGSYTGLRVGASTAKALCYGLDIPLIAVSTLASLVQPSDKGQVTLSTLDARRMESYAAIYSKGEVIKETHSIIWTEEIADQLASNFDNLIICGTGIEKAKSLFEPYNHIKVHPNECSAAHLIPHALDKYATKDFVNLAYHTPFYFKSPNITTSKKKFI